MCIHTILINVYMYIFRHIMHIHIHKRLIIGVDFVNSSDVALLLLRNYQK